MADLVNPIVDIVSRLGTYCATQTSYLCKLQQNKIKLSDAMDELKEARDDVQRKVVQAEADLSEPKMRTNQVRGWLERVRDIEGEVEKILQKADEQQLSSRARCVGGCCPPNNCRSNYKLGKSIAKRIPLVVELKGKGNFEEVTYILPPPSVQDMNREPTVGMEPMFDEVWSLINSTDDKPVSNTIGLYGQGGVGKTTLLEKINNKFKEVRGFDIVMFVVVSKPLNYQTIQKKIGERLGLSLQGDESNKIFNALRNKNFVLLLDDIWENVDLRRIGIPIIHPQGNSSKLIFTTRSEHVCAKMKADKKFKVECLPKDKAWRLFKENVGEEALNYFPDAREKAKIIAEECDGLPLALIALGKAMSTKKSVQEWNDAIRTLQRYASEFKDMRNEVLPSLKLSYDYLDDETEKSCFRYCSLYPEDHSIRIAKLIDIWIAEGYLDGIDNLGAARDRGHTIIGNLKSACLLESSGEYKREKTHVKMHDVIRDLALWIVNDCKSSSSSSTTDKFLVASKVVCERWRNAERIFWNIPRHMEVEVEVEEPPKSLNLRTLLVQGTQISMPQNFFQFTPSLRVLDMSGTGIKELPTSICELYELQYLNLSSTNIKELPVELGKLVKLKFLDLTHVAFLEKIPPGVIANLSELQVLKLAHSGFTVRVLKEEEEEEDGDSDSDSDSDDDGDGGLSLGELDRLKQLQEVTLNISTSLAAFEDLLKRLGELDRICTALVFQSCENLKSFSLPPPKRGGLGNFICLKELRIRWCGELEELILFINNEGGAAAAAGLPINSSNHKLERLVLLYLPKLNNIVWEWGEKYHHYMAAAQQQHYLHYYASPFQNLHEIQIDGCHALKDLTWVAYVESLKHLDVKHCKGIETIIVELGGDVDDGGLEEEGASGGGGGGGDRVFRRLETLIIVGLPKLKSICSHALLFPSIEWISIGKCPRLKKLPLDSRSNINNTLEVIQGEEEWWSELQWEDETIKSKFLPYYKENT